MGVEVEAVFLLQAPQHVGSVANLYVSHALLFAVTLPTQELLLD